MANTLNNLEKTLKHMIEIKAGNVANLTDARYFSAKGTKIMGFDLDSNSPLFVPPEKLHAIIEWVDGVEFAGHFGLTPLEEIQHLVETLNLNYIQLPHFSDPALHHELIGHKTIRQWMVEKGQSVDEIGEKITDWAPQLWGIELDFTASGLDPLAGESIGTKGLNQLLSLHRIYLKAPFSLSNIARIKKLDPMPTLTFSGGEEEKTGLKSYEHIDDILDYLEDEGLYDPYA